MEITKIIIISFFKKSVYQTGEVLGRPIDAWLFPQGLGGGCDLQLPTSVTGIGSVNFEVLTEITFILVCVCSVRLSVTPIARRPWKEFFYFSSVHIFLGIRFCYSLYVNWYWEISSKQVVEKKYCESSVCARAIFIRRKRESCRILLCWFNENFVLYPGK